MKTTTTAIATIILVGFTVQYATAETIPDWIKNNAAWWAEGNISEDDFVQGIQFLVKEGILNVPPTNVSDEKSNSVPEWVKNNAAWWADGTISDTEFLNGIQHLIKVGIVSVASSNSMEKEMSASEDSEIIKLEAELEECASISIAYKRIDCEKAVESQITLLTFQNGGSKYEVGPITFYWPGIGTEGNSFEISETGQPILAVRMLAQNTGSSDNVTLFCTGPAVCNYDVTDGSKAYKYSGMDFTNGQIVLKPGDFREFNMLFGPNIGYGGTTFEYESGKDYQFRISEPWGKLNIPLGI